jgi:hypothetical protein
MEQKGFRQFWKAPEGESIVELYIAERPREIVNKISGKTQAIFHINVNGQEFDWAITKRSPLYRDLIRALIGKTGETVKIKVLRLGQGRATRYSIKVVE